MCRSHGDTEPLETSESNGTHALKMTLSGASHDSWSMLYGGVLTGGLLKETEEKGSTNGSTFIPLYSELRTA